ncbi:hypothetical protein [Methylobacterium sp.]|uniref:hypothetical protein n=1 Tax=Methylobacterium sp. TaxID=409 RepID=UPI003AFFEB14
MTDERVLRAAKRREFWAAIGAGRTALITVMIVSGLINLLMLTAPIFMLQVYDRVLPSRSIATLVGLAGIALMLFVIQSVFEVFRARILSRFGRLVDERLGPRIFRTLLARGSETPRGDDGPRPCATSTPCGASCRVWRSPPSSTCPGCRSTLRSASCSIPGSGRRSRPAPCSCAC